MNCLPCFGSNESENNEQENSPVAQSKGHPSSQPPVITMGSPSRHANQPNKQNQEIAATDTNETNEVGENSARNFGFREMLMATKNFRRETLLGESTVGKVYKGTLRDTGQVVAVKQLDRHGTKANKEFLADVLMLSRLQHPNLVNLIGYCADGDQRILVYEYMEMGSLKNHLHEILPEREPLDWITRMKIASGAAQALEYLHEETNPPILYRNFTSSNILFDENMEPKLTDYGLVRLQIDAGNTMQQRMVCSVSCAPEYEKNGDLTKKSDIYSFGVVLLELITGRKALDTTRPVDEQNLVKWAQPYFKEPKRFPEMADPLLNGSFPDKSLNQAVGVAAMCVQDDPSVRPMISDVVAALSFLTVAPPPQPQPQPQPQIDPASATGSTNERSCSSSSSLEAEEEIDASSSQNDGTEDYSYSDSEDEDEQPMRINNKTGYNEDRGATSSSESLYNEDDYWEDESLQEETSYRSESKPKSIKRKVTIGTDKRSVIRNSSNGNNNSLKHHAGSSMRKKSVNRKSSKNNERHHVSLSKKSYGVCGDDQNSCDPYTLKNNSSSKNNEKVDVSLSNKTEDDQSSSSKQYESSKKSFSKNNNSNTHSSSRRSSVTTVPSKSHSKRSTTTKVPDKSHSKRSTTRVPSKSQSRRSQGEKLKKGESSDSSFSSDSGKNSTRFVGLDSRRKNERESESRSNNNDVEILDGGEDINARLLEDTYVPI